MPSPTQSLTDSLNSRLSDLSEKSARMVYLSAIPLWLDSDMMMALHGSREQAAAAAQALEQLNVVVRAGPERAAIRPEARQYLLHAGWRGQLPDYTFVNRRMADYCLKHLEQEPEAARRIRWARAGTYHLLAAGEPEGWSWLARLYEDAEARGLTSTALQVLEPLVELRPLLTRDGRSTLAYYKARAALLVGKQRKAECLFQAVIASARPATVVGVAHRGLGRALALRQRWSEALTQFRRSQKTLRASGDDYSLALTRLDVGDMYQEMAEFTGGILSSEILPGSDWLANWLRGFFQLPRLVYRQVSRRLQRLPFINVGVDYQNWTTARLMLAAAENYRRAIRGLAEEHSPQPLYEARSGMARVYAKLGMERRAEQLLLELDRWSYAQESEYRQAQVRFRRAELAEARRQYDLALELLQPVLEVFSRYAQRHGLARVYHRLGSIQAHLGEDQAAIRAYLHAAKLYAETRQYLSRTAVINELARLNGEAPDDDGRRDYLARFPIRMARLHRWLAFVLLSPMLLVGLLAFLGLLNVLIRAEFFLAPRGLLALAVITLPFVLGWLVASAWLFQTVYLGLGLALSFLLPVGALERDPLLHIVLDEKGLSMAGVQPGGEAHIEYEEIVATQTMDYQTRLRPIGLISYMDLLANKRRWRIPALTIGYRELRADLQRRLSTADWQVLTFRIIFHPINYIILGLLIPGGILFQIAFEFGVVVLPEDPANWTEVAITGIFVGAFITFLLLVPLATLWRLSLHEWRAWRSTPPGFPRPNPGVLALAQLAAVIWTVLTFLYAISLAARLPG